MFGPTNVGGNKGGSSITLWKANTSYAENDTVIHDGYLYVCKTANTSTESFDDDVASWQKQGASATTKIASWTPKTSYEANDVVIYKGSLYVCKETYTSSENFDDDANQWQSQNSSAAQVELEVPTQHSSLTYTGTEQSPTWDGFNEAYMKMTGDTAATDAGTYTVTFVITSSNAVWSDGTITNKTATWSISGIQTSIPEQNGSLTYNGSEQSPSWTNYNTDTMTVSGDTVGTDAGTYSAIFTPNKNYSWTDGTSGPKTVSWTISRSATAKVPAQASALTYTGAEQSPTWDANYDSNTMEVSGTTTGTNADTYTATFTLNKNYAWEDGTTDMKSVTWSIGKAAGSVSASPTSLSLSKSKLSDTTTITKTGDGAITATSSDEKVATVSVTDNVVTVTAVDKGNATVTINVASSENYAAASTTVSVSVVFLSENMSDNSEADVIAAIKSGSAASLWEPGDSFPIAINGKIGNETINGTYYATLLGFDHNSSREGANRAHFIIGKNSAGKDIAFCGFTGVYSDSSITGFYHNSSGNNGGGWKSSHIRTVAMPALKSALSADLQAAITPTTKWTASAGNTDSNNMSTTSDDLFLLSEYEIFGSRSYANQYESTYCKQYDYYKNGNSKVRYNHKDGSAVIWWERSPGYGGSGYHFCYVYTAGSASYNIANLSRGLAPGFSIESA